MLTFDFHAHVYTHDVADKLIGKMEEMYGVRRSHDATVEGALASAKNGGIDRVVVLPVANRPEHVRFNDWYAQVGREHETLVCFGSIHPDNDPAELDRFPELGLKGIKFQPNAQRFYPDDRRVYPIYKRAAELGLIAVFHTGDEQGGVKGTFSEPERFIDVVKSFPDLTIVLTHFGGYMQWHRVDPLLGHEHVYFDTAFLPGMMDDALFVSLAERIGFNRILFGTDFPFKDHKTEREYVERLFGPELAMKFISDNPLHILGLVSKATPR